MSIRPEQKRYRSKLDRRRRNENRIYCTGQSVGEQLQSFNSKLCDGLLSG